MIFVEKSHATNNAMIAAGTSKLFFALAKYHYVRTDCPIKKEKWANVLCIKPPKKKRGPKPMDKETRAKAARAARTIGKNHGFSAKELFGKRKGEKLCAARYHCYHHLHKHGMSYKDIGRVMNRDHSTVMHGVAKFIEAKNASV